jgi:hypothetical protein
VDGDGDIDLLATTFTTAQEGSSLVLYENTDNGRRFDVHLLDTLPLVDSRLDLVDLDGDLDLDLLVSRQYEADAHIVWLENGNGQGDFNNTIPVANFGEGALTMAWLDMDGDGDVDVVSSRVGSSGQIETSWHENLEGNGTFIDGGQLDTDPDGLASLWPADLDNDGDPDIVAGSHRGGKLLWYENLGLGEFSDPRLIAQDGQSEDAVLVRGADLNSDGRLDLVATFLDSGQVIWYEQAEAEVTFSLASRIASNLEKPLLVAILDTDVDGDLDLVTADNPRLTGPGMLVHKNRLIGDANDDGRFDQLDIVQLLQAGEYEDRISGNSTYEEGDFDGDGDFTALDIVFAQQAGTYLNA